jgi:hypothetical protein
VCALVAPTALFAAKPKPAKTTPAAEATPEAKKEGETTAATADRGKAQLFAKYDTNKNGKLDEDEIAAVQKDFAAASKKNPLRRLDTNKNGKLDDDEINALLPSAKKGGKKSKKTAAAAKPDDAKPAEPGKKPEDPK